MQAEIEIWGIKTSQLNNNFKSQNMTYKKAQPKIADSLSVFIDQIGKIEKNTESLQKVSDGLNKKIEIFHQFEPKINFKPLETINNKHIAVLEEMTFRINKTLNSHTISLEKERVQKNTMFSRLYILIFLLFFTSLLACVASINFKNKKDKAELSYIEAETARKKQTEDFSQFLTDAKLWTKYKKWANR